MERELAAWEGYRRALRREDRIRFDEMMRLARAHASAATVAGRPFPLEPVLVSILLEHQKILHRLCARLSEGEETEAPPDAGGGEEVSGA